MLDNQLISLVISTIIAQEAAAGIPGTPLAQAFQPTQQGVNTVPTVYLYKVGDKRYGFRGVTDIWNVQTSQMVHTETQQYETTLQFSALATQNPATPSQYTASDILNLVAYIVQSSATVAALEAQGVGVERVTDVRNPYFSDDRDRFEASPNFDVVLTHKQIITTTTPILQTTEIQIATV
ncbi:phage gateway protein [Fimbriiglobus ruber]|uniref:Phage protein n=1 Tax=Fimbriiglobus ruber TaxID=1908690 RepID=A0A225DU72_9BACT|nr:hypothetical protein [Fimbriiglobus ruber]OWK42058.1 Phage protein [Fimbriiglobus ruber]